MAAWTPPKMIQKKITECILDNSDRDWSAFDFIVNYATPGGEDPEYKIFSGLYFIDRLISDFSNRWVITREEDPEIFFYQLFDQWRYNRNRAFATMAHAIMTNYDPMGVYDITEELLDDVTEHEKGSSFTKELTPFTKETTEKTPFTAETTEKTPFTKETTEKIPFTKETTETTPFTAETTVTESNNQNVPTSSTTNSRMAFNSNTWSNTEKSETTTAEKETLTKSGKEKVEYSITGTEKTEKSYTGTEKTEHYYEGTEKIEKSYTGTQTETTTGEGTDTDTRNYTKHIYGTKSDRLPATAIATEYDNIMINLADLAISEFIDKYTFYAEEVII